MIKRKFLSDSSTSESEDDAYKIPHLGFSSTSSPPGHVGHKYSSTSESEDDITRKLQQSTMPTFHTGNVVKRKLDNERDMNPSRKIGKMDIRNEFKMPSSYRGTDHSGSESDDRSSAERSISADNTVFNNASEAKHSDIPTHYNGKSLKMMEKMGWTGSGLGKYNQGRTQIIEASKQRGRRGLGLHIEGLEPADIVWDFDKEQESAKEGVSWIPDCHDEPALESELEDWMMKGEKKLTIDDEITFCDPSILKNVIEFKTVFDNLEPEEMRRARTRSNPFETIRGGIFLNRAAMKMANMDSAFDFMFTDPKDEIGKPVLSPGDLLYFADVCSGPGGFSEYVLWRKKWKCKGFGFTLKGENDFKLDDFFAGPPETFEPYYGERGVDGDGNVYYPENLMAFCNFVMNSTEGKGVHFVMADGGFSVEGQENIQEILSKRLYLCQFLCALMILRTGGHFVCKLFDVFTTFSVGLIYLMYRAFQRVSIFKPNTSRPANSERYIVCKWRKKNTTDICDYLFKVNMCLNDIATGSDEDISEVVPLHVIKSDEPFFDYICDSNNVIGERQILHLAKIRAFTQNTELHEDKQSIFRKECLEIWKVPDLARAAPSRTEPGQKFENLIKGEQYPPNDAGHLNVKSLSQLDNIFDFKAVICGENQNGTQPTFFISLGRCNIYHLDSKSNKWPKSNVKVELPAETIFYGELIYELQGEGKGQKKVQALHIIDALFLGGTDVRKLHYGDRIAQAQMLVKAVSKPSRSDYIPLRVKQVWGLDEIKSILNRLIVKQTKGSNSGERLCFQLEDSKDSRHFIPSGMLILKTTADPWITAFSKSHQREYYFNTKKNKSVYERVPEFAASFKVCLEKRIFWSWTRNVKLLSKHTPQDDAALVHGDIFWTFIRSQYQQIMKQMPHF